MALITPISFPRGREARIMRRVATINLQQDHSEYSNDNKDVRGGGICAPSDVKEMDETEFLNGCSVNFRDYDRRTALHVACSEGHAAYPAAPPWYSISTATREGHHRHAALARELVLSGARAHRLDRWGGPCLGDALRHRHALISEWLRTRGRHEGNRPVRPAFWQGRCSRLCSSRL